MATKRTIELKEMSVEDIQAELKSAMDNYNKLKFDHSISGLANPMVLRSARKDIARLNTELRGREVEAMTPEQLNKRNNIRRRRKVS